MEIQSGLGIFLFISQWHFFALAYTLCGADALKGAAGTSTAERLLDGFFFSVHTLTTVGFGHVSPSSYAANLVATVELFLGFLMFAIVTGLVFARFSRPSARILFSDSAVIAPYGDMHGFEFRIANERYNQLLEIQVKVVFSRNEIIGSKRKRRFYELTLERPKVAFMPLHLTVVHPIDEHSPLHGITNEALHGSNAEFLVLVTAIDGTFSQVVQARSSYKANEIICDGKFKNMLDLNEDGIVNVDLHRIHDLE